MSKNLFIVIIILGCWIAVITVFSKKSLPKKELKQDEIIEVEKKEEVSESPADARADRLIGNYYDQRNYTA